MSSELAQSYRYCRAVARKEARNFYYAFVFLPRERSDALSAIYAFSRYCDDVSDGADPSDAPRQFQSCRDMLRRALGGDTRSHPMLPAVADTAKKFQIPEHYFLDLIHGTEMDLTVNRYETFDQLYEYCYHVASVIGLFCIHIFGFTDSAARKLAEYRGVAFQLTNILRDVREDAARGRIYLPREDLQKFNVTEAEILGGHWNDRIRDLLRFEGQRAGEFYEKSAPLDRLIDRRSRPALAVMTAIYRALLDKIAAHDFQVMHHRIALSAPSKVRIALRTWLRTVVGGDGG